MKHMIRMCIVVLMPLLLVAGYTACSSKKNKPQNNQGTQQMERLKTKSGLEYQVIRPGSGQAPNAGRQVTVHYTGWLNANGQPGKKFDSSVDRGRPFTFVLGVGQVIPGWDEGVALMTVGEKGTLFIPSNLGYGTHGAGGTIPPNANLIFEVELLSVS